MFNYKINLINIIIPVDLFTTKRFKQS